MGAKQSSGRKKTQTEVSTSLDRTSRISSQSDATTNIGNPLTYMYSQSIPSVGNATGNQLNTSNTQMDSDNVRAMGRSGMNTIQTYSAASKNTQKRPAPSTPAPQLNHSSNAMILPSRCHPSVSRANGTSSCQVNGTNVTRTNMTSSFQSWSETSKVTSPEVRNASSGGSSQSIPSSLSLENKADPHSWAVFKKVRLYLYIDCQKVALQ